MEYVWDLKKAKANRIKHGIDFADAVIALEDDLALTILDPDFPNEDRFVSLGRDAFGRLLVTAFVLRESTIRVISSRKASRGERRMYESRR
ncbi:MAG: BrnT family toxin [Pseudomonadota bacterium]